MTRAGDTDTNEEHSAQLSPVAMARVAQLATRENIGMTLIAIIAADYFGITERLLNVILGVC